MNVIKYDQLQMKQAAKCEPEDFGPGSMDTFYLLDTIRTMRTYALVMPLLTLNQVRPKFLQVHIFQRGTFGGSFDFMVCSTRGA